MGILLDQEAGEKTADLTRTHEVSEATLDNWKAKFGGMNGSDAMRPNALRMRTGS
jgi:putative transposase